MIHTNLTATRIIRRRGLSQAERAFAVCRSDVGQLPQKVMRKVAALLKF